MMSPELKQKFKNLELKIKEDRIRYRDRKINWISWEDKDIPLKTRPQNWWGKEQHWLLRFFYYPIWFWNKYIKREIHKCKGKDLVSIQNPKYPGKKLY